ncbi:hypothetical protein Msil_3308 [Methylocella silvestris BL2]|uniref:SnoaL-like domain-containing protein n=1 Tax=Methylocella silvestris (strain DSM 15510 / CIP 108128 / LMG 27833 / NCIMB 13906 / BL2) TaxID=395965 RepID=B8EQK2_METSB|nr:nuclear transport factor 2 family protein [Methylocella silvestris]ACK52215.1 hypothetical protein Msil_3308 [Methylocella silvestris BL2]
MTAEADMKAAIRAGYAARLAEDVPKMLSFFTEDAEFAFNVEGLNLTGDGAPVRGRKALEAIFTALVAAFKIEDWTEISLTAEGDRAVLHWRATVKSTKTGASSLFDVVDLVTFRDGLFASLYQHTDTAKLAAIAGPGALLASA